jgi:hypothetical protein
MKPDTHMTRFSAFCMVIAAMLCTAFLRCGSAPTLAGGTDMPNESKSIVAGFVYTTGGATVGNAGVALCKPQSVSVDSTNVVAYTVSSAQGYYQFSKVAQGSYSIRALSADSSLVVSAAAISVISNADTITRRDTLQKACTLTGSCLLPRSGTARVFCAIQNKPFFAELDGSGRFNFTTLEPGPAELRIVVTDSGRAAIAATRSMVLQNNAPNNAGIIDRLVIVNNSKDVVLDDFEDSTIFNANGNIWWPYTDSSIGGTTTAIFEVGVSPGAFDSGRCIRSTYMLDTIRPWTFAGIGTTLGPRIDGLPVVYDLTKLSSISFSCRGTPSRRIDILVLCPVAKVYTLLTTLYSIPQTWTTITLPIDSAMATITPEQRQSWLEHAPLAESLQWTIIRQGDGASPGIFEIDNIVLHYK